MSYYERLLKTLLDRLLTGKFITPSEVQNGRPDPGSPRETPRLTPAMVEEQLKRRGSLRRDDVRVPARFKNGQHVLARNINPVGHTRLPRYLRGKRGCIQVVYGIKVLYSGGKITGQARYGTRPREPCGTPPPELQEGN